MATENDIPEIYRRGDGLDAVSMARQAMKTAEVITTPMPAGGDLGAILAWAERLMPEFLKAGEMLMKMKNTDWKNGAAASPMATSGDAPPPTPPPPPPPAQMVIDIDPMKIYQRLCGYLAQAPQDMTVGAVLTMARDNKEMVLIKIKEELAGAAHDRTG